MTAPTQSFTAGLLIAVAEHLAAAGVGRWEPDRALAYGPDDAAIRIGSMPSTPDLVAALTPYPVLDDVKLADSVVGLQVRLRGRPDDLLSVLDLDDRVFDALHGLTYLQLPGDGLLLLAERQSGAPIGLDRSDRPERTSNFHLTCTRPSTHRPATA